MGCQMGPHKNLVLTLYKTERQKWLAAPKDINTVYLYCLPNKLSLLSSVLRIIKQNCLMLPVDDSKFARLDLA